MVSPTSPPSFATRPLTRGLTSTRLADTSPCTVSGAGRVANQSNVPSPSATAARTTQRTALMADGEVLMLRLPCLRDQRGIACRFTQLSNRLARAGTSLRPFKRQNCPQAIASLGILGAQRRKDIL